MDGFDQEQVRQKATRLRLEIVDMIAEAASGHPGGSLSSADIVAVLFFGGILRYDPARPDWPERDRFILSKGHAAPVLYAALAEAGYFSRDELPTLRKLGSMLQGHPDSKKTPGVEVSTGSLGQGLSVANGIAAGLKLDGNPARVYCLLGDGECQEGQVWEAAMFAAHHQLDNVTAIVDRNHLQIDGRTEDVVSLGDIGAKFAAFGWNVIPVDGHDLPALHDALRTAAAHEGAPSVLVAATTKGCGVSFMEDNADWHGKATTAEETERAREELNACLLEGGDRG